nr:type ISP restriction/modification enzyme [Helicobacter marmotae]
MIFSTYQSIDVLIEAQKYFKHQIKFIINDEAHRTAGVQKLDGEGEKREISVWQKTHNNALLNAKYRLYLTATPRIYSPEAKNKKTDQDLLLFSMDDEKLFGSEIYNLKFYQAIQEGLLSDFRVVISYISEEYISKFLSELSKQSKLDEHKNLDIERTGKYVALSHALKKQNLHFINTDGTREEFKEDGIPLKRAIAFHRSIRDSKIMEEHFPKVSPEIDVKHIDGTFNAYEKAEKLAWLSDGGKGCLVLSNAKCLTEGIDVPNLDAVCFLDKRDSVVDIVQAVGRAIRKSEGKKYGYIILPILLSEKEIQNYDATLRNNKKFKIVWDVLKALRSHDERLVDEARINEVLMEAYMPQEANMPEGGLFGLDELLSAMHNAIPKHLGDLQYWENYAPDVGDSIERLGLRITTLTQENANIKKLFTHFCKSLQNSLNASFEESEAIALIAQHIVTKPIFEHIFPHVNFATFDKVSAELEKFYEKLLAMGLGAERESLEKFYMNVKSRAEFAQSDKSKQNLIKNLYDTLFKKAFKKDQQKLGIVCTPLEGVDFIIHSIAYALKKHFNKNLSDNNVHICDPFTGTGTFITRLIQSGYLDSNLESKYKKELWANEITLLGYYIAQINISASYHERLLKLRETSALGRHSSDLENFEGSQAHSLASPPKFSKNPQSPTANLRSLESQAVLQSKDFPLEQHNPKNSSTTLECQNINEMNLHDSQSPFCHSKHCEETSPELPATPLVCHSERSEESLSESLVAKRDSSPLAGVQNDKIISLAGSQVCHHEGGRSPTEESLLSTKDSLTETLERRLLCHSERSEESLKESLVAHRDSSVVSLPQNDNSGRVSSNPKSNSSLENQAKNDKIPNHIGDLDKANPQEQDYILMDNLLFTDTFNTYTPDSKGFKVHIAKRESESYQGEYFKKNYQKITEFKNTDFKVFVGNPPYSTGQESANDNNQNTEYPYLEQRIAETYQQESIATSTTNASYDSFKLAIRYCSDRIGESGGIIGFITNGSFIDNNTDDGFRASLASEFDYIYIFNLRGNAGTAGELRKKEGGGFFDSGSKTPAAIVLLIKSGCEELLFDSPEIFEVCDSSLSQESEESLKESLVAKRDSSVVSLPQNDKLCYPQGKLLCHSEGFMPEESLPESLVANSNSSLDSQAQNDKMTSHSKGVPHSKAAIYYYDIGDYKSREEKLNTLNTLKSIETLDTQGLWSKIEPNKDYDWINQRDYSFMAFMPIGNTDSKLKSLQTLKNIKNKDKLDSELLQEDYVDIFEMFSAGVKSNRDSWIYNFSRKELESNMRFMIANYNAEVAKREQDAGYQPIMDETKIKWTDNLKSSYSKNFRIVFDSEKIQSSFYRPFCKMPTYYDKSLFHSTYKMSLLYPSCNLLNLTICVVGRGSNKEFSALMTSYIIEYALLQNSQCFPLYYYEELDSIISKEEALLKGISEATYKQMQDNPQSSFYHRKDAIRDEALARFREVYKAFWEIHPEYKAPCNAGDSTLLLSQMRNCSFTKESKAFQARGEGSLVSLNDRAESAESAIYRCEISKDSIFYYIYALLNHPTYKAKYKDNLSKMLPRIPFMKDFFGFEKAGRELASLHLNYEAWVEKGDFSAPCGAFACLAKDLRESKESAKGLFANNVREMAAAELANLGENDFRIDKLKFRTKGITDTILFNEKIAIVNIPPKAYEYVVNGKSAIEWIMDRYAVSVDTKSGIVNDPNLYVSQEGALAGLKGGRYALNLLLSVIEMSVRSVEVIGGMPKYEVLEV